MLLHSPELNQTMLGPYVALIVGCRKLVRPGVQKIALLASLMLMNVVINTFLILAILIPKFVVKNRVEPPNKDILGPERLSLFGKGT